MTTTGIGVQSLLPEGIVDGYGYDAGSNTYLLEPLGPLFGDYTNDLPFGGTVDLGSYPNQAYTKIISEVAWNAVLAGVHTNDPAFHLPGYVFRWRLKDSSDPWTDIPSPGLNVELHSPLVGSAPQHRGDPNEFLGDGSIDYLIDYFNFQDARLDVASAVYDPAAPVLPNDGDAIEFFLLGPHPPSAKYPILIEGTSAGQVAGQSVVNVSNTPVLGQFEQASVGGGITTGTVVLTALPGNAVSLRELPVALYNLIPNFDTSGLYFFPMNAELKWRIAGSMGPWTTIPLDPATPGAAKLGFALLLVGSTPDAPVPGPYRIFTSVGWTVPTADAPADLDDIEFTVTSLVAAPGTVLTAGQFVVNVYDGLYSRRDPITQAVVPTGILYDAAAVLQMTDPVRIRITEPIEDAREWLEKYIYAPTGWVPALDVLGRISPVSQVPPSDTSGLPVLTNAITEPSVDWNAGDRIVNLLRFTYYRDYATGPLDNPVSGTDERQRRLVDPPQKIEMEFRDETSITRHGEQKLELDGRAFHAIGKDDPTGPPPTLTPPPITPGLFGHARLALYNAGATWLGTMTASPNRIIIPVGTIEDEVGFQLAQARDHYLNSRYGNGATAIGVNVMRAAMPLLRVGDWVVLNLSWLPDYITQRRGLLAMGHIISLGDLDCAWRRLLIELVTPEAGS